MGLCFGIKMKFTNPKAKIEREKELEELRAMKRILIKKGSISQIEIDKEKTK